MKLNKIFLIGLPEEEIKYLKKNIKNSDGLQLFTADALEELWSSGSAEEFQKSAESGMVISGSRKALKKAAACHMAAIGYQKRPDTGDKAGPPYLQADMIVEGFEEVDARFLIRVFERRHHIPWKILETERCMLREFEMNDLDALFTLYSYPGMTDYMEGLYPYEKELAYQKAYIEHMYRFYGYGMWLVFDKSAGELIGRAGVEQREELGGELELGYAIGTPFRRQGYAEEICRAILDYVKKELGFQEVVCLIREGNDISVHLAEKLGFQYQTVLTIDGGRMLKYRLRLL